MPKVVIAHAVKLFTVLPVVLQYILVQSEHFNKCAASYVIPGRAISAAVLVVVGSAVDLVVVVADEVVVFFSLMITFWVVVAGLV